MGAKTNTHEPKIPLVLNKTVGHNALDVLNKSVSHQIVRRFLARPVNRGKNPPNASVVLHHHYSRSSVAALLSSACLAARRFGIRPLGFRCRLRLDALRCSTSPRYDSGRRAVSPSARRAVTNRLPGGSSYSPGFESVPASIHHAGLCRFHPSCSGPSSLHPEDQRQ
jgi:hypothetical protein